MEKEKQDEGNVCPTCNSTGKVEEGEHDDIREVDCPDCIELEVPDFSGATEGDR